MKAVLYARVSSERQAEKDLSISAQLKALRKYAENKGFEIVREFVDEAESARTADRPAFQEMISLAKSKSKPFDAVLVWKLSRFARNREDSIIFKSLLKKKGIQVLSINEQIDDSPAGSLLEGIIEVIDEFYSANLAQDTKRGMRESASRGFYTGGIPPIGYKIKPIEAGNTTKKTLEIDDDFAPIVCRIFNMAISGTGAKEIAKKLNEEGIATNRGAKWTKNIILYLLRNEIYIGTLVWGKSDKTQEPLRIEDNFPAIIEKEIFQRVQKLIEERSPVNCNPKTLQSPYLLSGLIFCGNCGYAMQGGSAKSGRFHYYSCNNSIRKGKQSCDARMV
ncbi:MAG: recombinase family protein, partial [Nitrospirota bacterium]